MTNHTCAVLTGGAVDCWGDGGALGNGSLSGSYKPVRVLNVSNARAVWSGFTHVCALQTTGGVMCWGSCNAGLLGDGDDTCSYKLAVPVKDITTAVGLAVGAYHACAVLQNGTVSCWGGNSQNQLGASSVGLSSYVPVAIPGLTNVTAIAAGAYHNCVVIQGGTVQCWGMNDNGQVASTFTSLIDTPTPVAGVTGATRVGGGYSHSCAIVGNGAVKCWGFNMQGQLGNMSYDPSRTPVDTMGITSAKELAVGYWHTCALLTTGAMTCWGDNEYGQLADGAFNAYQNVPVATAPGLAGVTSLIAGGFYNCVRLNTGEAACWGRNLGLGNGNGYDQRSPVPVVAE
jgi:alpha-tubulin suppressor-like RCC1 family protein